MDKEDYIQRVIKTIAEKEEIVDYSVKILDNTSKADGYLGLIQFVEITANNSDKVLNVAIKSAYGTKEQRKTFPIRHAFTREIYVYSAIFPQFANFQLENKIRSVFTAHPRCFYANDSEFNEVIAMDNLKKRGFSLWPRSIPMDEAHLKFALKTYAEFHSISLAMRRLNAPLFEEICANSAKGMTEHFLRIAGPAVKVTFEKLHEILAEKGKIDAAQRVVKLKDYVFDEMRREEENKDDYVTIIHGDCWTNNMMFKYENNDKVPSEMSLLDFQLVYTAFPGYDVANFFYMCASGELYEEKDKFLRIYYEALSENLVNYGLAADKVLPREQLEKRWGKCARSTLVYATFVFKAMLVDPEEATDVMDASTQDERGSVQALSKEFARSHEYYEKLEKLIEHLVKFNYI